MHTGVRGQVGGMIREMIGEMMGGKEREGEGES